MKRSAAALGVLEELRFTARYVRQTLLFAAGLILRTLGFGRTYDRLMVAPGRNPWVELRSKSPFLALLCSAYRFYTQQRMEASSGTNEEFQRKYWSGYPAHYISKAREDYDNDFYRTFDGYFQQAVMDRDVKRCLDIGCGGFTHILRLKRRYPHIEFVGIDISRVSEEIWNESIKPFHGGIRFIPGSITGETKILEEIDLFYTFGSLMCLTQSEIEPFFSALKRVSRPIVGLIVEADNIDEEPVTHVKGHSFFHNYLEYFKRFDFRVLDYTRRNHHIEADLPMLFAYFSTK